MQPNLSPRYSRLATALVVVVAVFGASRVVRACANQGNDCPGYCNGSDECNSTLTGPNTFTTCQNVSANSGGATNSVGIPTMTVQVDYLGGTCNPHSYSAPQIHIHATFNPNAEVRDLHFTLLDANGSQIVQRNVCPGGNCPSALDYTTEALGANPAFIRLFADETCTRSCPTRSIVLLQCFPGCAACVNQPDSYCDDRQPCTRDGCNPVTNCFHTIGAGDPCDDGKPCTTSDRCGSDGICRGQSNCGDGNPCTKDVCTTYGCAYPPKPNGTSCSDGNACTTSDACRSGQCVGSTVTCNDGNPCTMDGCDPARGCTATPVRDGTVCSDQDACNGTETCQAGTCRPGTPPNCDDGNTCTTDRCDTGKGCRHGRVPDCVDDLLPGIFAATLDDD